MQFRVVIFVAIFEGAQDFVSNFPQHETCSSHFPLSKKLQSTPFGQEAMELHWFGHDYSLISIITFVIDLVHDVIFCLQQVHFHTANTHSPYFKWTNNIWFVWLHFISKLGQIGKCLYVSLSLSTESQPWVHIMLPKMTQPTCSMHLKCSLAHQTSFFALTWATCPPTILSQNQASHLITNIIYKPTLT